MKSQATMNDIVFLLDMLVSSNLVVNERRKLLTISSLSQGLSEQCHKCASTLFFYKHNYFRDGLWYVIFLQ